MSPLARRESVPFSLENMKYIYGPVKSRRLGLSLGITLTPYKICNFDCLYCQLGLTAKRAGERKEYIKIKDILEELKTWLKENIRDVNALSYITLSGSGEPALNLKIGGLIQKIKSITPVPVAVITNASLMRLSSVRRALAGADLVVPSLDAGTQRIFEKINRPHKGINLKKVIKGLENFRRQFRGKIWLEIMLVRGINDDIAHIQKLKQVIDKINPDKIQLNSPVRSTPVPGILPVEKTKLEQIKEILGDKCEII